MVNPITMCQVDHTKYTTTKQTKKKKYAEEEDEEREKCCAARTKRIMSVGSFLSELNQFYGLLYAHTT